jgi:hypothetical protein
MNRISAERRSATPGTTSISVFTVCLRQSDEKTGFDTKPLNIERRIKKTYCKYIGVTDTAALSNAQGKRIPRGPSFQEPQTQQNRLNTLTLIPAENKTLNPINFNDIVDNSEKKI